MDEAITNQVVRHQVAACGMQRRKRLARLPRSRTVLPTAATTRLSPEAVGGYEDQGVWDEVNFLPVLYSCQLLAEKASG